MTTFKLEIKIGNDSMMTGADISDALIRCAKNVNPDFNPNGSTLKRLIRDVNGNTVGHYLVVDDD